jgi:pilus assembly protein Flp/PilA
MFDTFEVVYAYMRAVVASRVKSERGATAVEYGLLVGLIAVAIIVAVAALGGKLSGLFQRTANTLP